MECPEGPEPWYKLDPEKVLDPCDESEEPELPTLAPTIGPASRSSAPVPNPMTVQPPNIDPGPPLLAKLLNWKVE